MSWLLSSASGLAMGLSLIVSIGAQNAFILRQGIRREHVLPVVAVCIASDVLLIGAGVAGFGSLVLSAPWILQVARFGGAAFLTAFGVMAVRRAVRPAALTVDETAGTSPAGPSGAGRRAPVLIALALTWLNPQVYLETVVLLGSVAAARGEQLGDTARWWFGGGAMTASVLWFSALGLGARYLRPLFAQQAAWRVLDAGVAVMMFALATLLVVNPL